MNVNETWEFIKDILSKGIRLYIPVIICTNKVKDKPPWLSTTVQKSVKKKHKLFKRFLESKSSLAYQEYIQVRNKVNKLIKNAKRNHEKKIANDCKSNPKTFWKYINTFRKCKEGISPLQREDGSLATDDKEKAEILIKFFSSVLTIEDLSNIPHIPPGANSNGEFITDIKIEQIDVQNKLKNLDPNKSPGPDKLYPRVLKELNVELAGPLTVLFNKSINMSKIPTEWKLAETTAIFKKGDKTTQTTIDLYHLLAFYARC